MALLNAPEAATLLDTFLNRGLPRSPRARELCRTLAGRTLAIASPGLARVVIVSDGTTLKLARSAQAADAEIIGGPLSLLALGRADPRPLVQQGDVRIRGDAELAESFRELLALLKPDWEEELSLLVGDVAAHRIGRTARLATDWLRTAGRTGVQNIAEYFAHETGDLVSRNEGEQFLRGVDVLREDVDRLAARLELLERRTRAR